MAFTLLRSRLGAGSSQLLRGVSSSLYSAPQASMTRSFSTAFYPSAWINPARTTSAFLSQRSTHVQSSPETVFSVSWASTAKHGVDISAPADPFVPRHIGSPEGKLKEMLNVLGLKSLDEVADKTIPNSIRLRRELNLGIEEGGESSVLQRLRNIVSENKLFKSYIGTGYYNTLTPAVIQRNMLENPLWYTPYTPYQAEISQGRMESLLNFQTMVSDLTGLPCANASLLDEATAGAEAMAYCIRSAKNKSHRFFVDRNVHPQTIAVIKTRAEPLGIEVVVDNVFQYDFASQPCLGFVVQYPNTEGKVEDYTKIVEKIHQTGGLACFASDLLALTLMKPPGEFGADVSFGNAQRFGVPLGYGGPHAAFFAIANLKDARKLPGRIIGVSKDTHGNPAMRLALQTREQHIRREKATSNICTAQALLANINAMYAVYHGPEGLKRIAKRVHVMTLVLQEGLRRLGHQTGDELVFDTIKVRHSSLNAAQVVKKAAEHQINLRPLDDQHVGISLDETVTTQDLADLFQIFASKSAVPFTPEELSQQVTSQLLESSGSSTFRRTSSFLTLSVFNSYHQEHELLRYMHKLQSRDLSLATSMIPLGSCTMKLNATAEMIPVTWPEIGQLHPFAPLDQTKGYQTMFKQLEHMLSEITGFDRVTFQPNAGSQGEYSGLMVIREYLKSKGQGHRDVCLIPSSAHGTNPASASMAGMKIVVIDCDDKGYINLQHLKEQAEKYKDQLACLMVTYPSTYGIFEEEIKGVCQLIHDNGGQVYLDGANMNALVGLTRPGDIGADVCHMNLHKTFCIPHGGGGPGMGPIAVARHLSPFLPGHPVVKEEGTSSSSLGPVAAAPWASASILPITWMYLNMMGAKGLKQATQVAILNANYMRKRLSEHYSIRFTSTGTGFCAHEFIMDFRPFKQSAGVEVADVSKRLMDYNFHSPTMSWPVPGTLMIEPTESESKEELDRLCDALIQIRHEIRQIEEGVWPQDNNPLHNAPHTAADIASDDWDKKRPYPRNLAVYPLPWVKENKFWPYVGRVDNVYGDTNLNCSCAPLDSYR